MTFCSRRFGALQNHKRNHQRERERERKKESVCVCVWGAMVIAYRYTVLKKERDRDRESDRDRERERERVRYRIMDAIIGVSTPQKKSTRSTPCAYTLQHTTPHRNTLRQINAMRLSCKRVRIVFLPFPPYSPIESYTQSTPCGYNCSRRVRNS